MMNRNVLFIVTEDVEYGEMVQTMFKHEKFLHVIYFENVEMCQKSLHKKPTVIITDYHLKKTTGLQLIQKAKAFNPACFTILISDDGPYGFNSFNDERFIRFVDKFIIKGMDDKEEIMEALTSSCVSQ